MNIETARLHLRYFDIKDDKNLLDYLSKPTANCFVENKISTIDEALNLIKVRKEKNEYIAVCLKNSDLLIGEIFFIKEEPDTYFIGWNFNARYQGQGFAHESAAAIMDYLFNQLNCRRIYAYVEDDNIASQKLCKRLGMRQEGCFNEFISFINNNDGTPKYENTCQYAILKKEYQPLYL